MMQTIHKQNQGYWLLTQGSTILAAGRVPLWRCGIMWRGWFIRLCDWRISPTTVMVSGRDS